jgi:broad specificity phosphatase PhoE
MTSNLFYMMRHGSTKLNEMEAYRGWSNGPGAELDEDGLMDAREAGAFLSRLRPNIKYVLCSDMNRAIETASIVCNILGIEDMEIDERLRPLNVGDLAGRSKSENPIDEYLKDTSKKFPGGESVKDFEVRQHSVAADIIGRIQKEKIGLEELLVIAHVSNVMFWYNLQTGSLPEEYLQEKSDLIYPGGAVLITDDSVVPILKRNTNGRMPLADGTALSGFVTEMENRPPRECWNCKWFSRDIAGGQCDHSLVRIDPELIPRRKDNGQVTVGDRDCCNNFQNHPST